MASAAQGAGWLHGPSLAPLLVCAEETHALLVPPAPGEAPPPPPHARVKAGVRATVLSLFLQPLHLWSQAGHRPPHPTPSPIYKMSSLFGEKRMDTLYESRLRKASWAA